ncbi:transporter [Streptomyces sp. KPB2]|uniref:copper resistance CopC/CopD family protein n=1 Tax=unclassified Streptomyces TaxID=2593676 RepID=UPI000F6F90CE|nr:MULTISPECIES: copper resistance protein CopC [unclassified Streptomyces]AZM76843.1 transporter [Streptomyces sp. KPB2]MBH5133900.1 copper resistance protein CopC/CopD [Streptomyces sp. HB-N217]
MLLGPVLVLLVLGGAGPASAHAALGSTDPEDGAVLGRAPAHVTLTFSESVGLRDDSFRVLDPGGHRLHTGEAGRADGRSDTARVALPGKLGEGTYTVAWRVVSADSHPVSGAFTFSVGKPSQAAAPVDTGPTEDPLTATLHKIARYLSYLAAALLIGAAAFVALCRPPDPAPLRRPLVAAWWTLLAATLALLVLRAPYEAGTGPSTALDPAVLRDTLTTRPGALLLTRLGLLLPVALYLARAARAVRVDRAACADRGDRRRGGRPLAAAVGVVLAVGLALTWAAAEHASAGIQVPIAMTSSVLHLLATAVWLGGLVALLVTLRAPRPSPDPAGVVARFSRTAFAAVTVLVVTGVYQSWRGLGSWQALTGSTYGRLLLAKVVLVAVLLAAAAVSRRWTAALVTAPVAVREPDRVPERIPQPTGGPPPETPKPPPSPDPDADPHPDADRGPDTDTGTGPGDDGPGPALRRGLYRSVLVEAVVAAVVLGVTTVLTATPPGRSAEEAARAAVPAGGVLPASVTTIPFEVGASGRGTVQITLDPGRTGDNAVQAVVFGPDGSLAAVPELRLSFTLPDKDLGPIGAELVDRGGYWSANTVTLPLPGTWTMKATVRVSEIDQVSETRRIRVER